MLKIFKSYQSNKEKEIRRKELKFGLLSGIALGLSFPPVPLPYLIFLALIPYFFVIEKRESLAGINRFTYFTAFFFNIITLYWVGSWTPDADPFLMVAGTVLMFFNPVVFLIPSTLFYFTKKYLNFKTALFLMPWFWLFYEYIYSVSDFKFPWLSLSNSLPYFNMYIQIADILGSYGLSVLVIYVNIFAYLTIKTYLANKRIDLKYLSLFIAFFLFPIIYGLIRLNSEYSTELKVKVGLVQPDLNPNKKWEIGNLNEQIDLYESLSNKALEKGAEIIVWPETALPVYLLTPSYRTQAERIQNIVDSSSVPILTGMPHAVFYPNSENAPPYAKPLKKSTGAYTSYNSILFFSPDSEIEQYGKIKLVPFGEKVPLVDVFPVLGKWIRWNVGISSWNTGTDTVVFNWAYNGIDTVNLGGVICIESIYPDFVSAFVKKGADIIAVVTNDSWYGNSSGPYQHKEISVLRAVENRKPVIRAANGGISCIIDHLGRTNSASKMFTRDVLVGDVILISDKTFFSQNPLLMPSVSIIIVVFIIIFIIIKVYNIRFSHD